MLKMNLCEDSRVVEKERKREKESASERQRCRRKEREGGRTLT